MKPNMMPMMPNMMPMMPNMMPIMPSMKPMIPIMMSMMPNTIPNMMQQMSYAISFNQNVENKWFTTQITYWYYQRISCIKINHFLPSLDIFNDGIFVLLSHTLDVSYQHNMKDNFLIVLNLYLINIHKKYNSSFYSLIWI